jgi:hypothetical protein
MAVTDELEWMGKEVIVAFFFLAYCRTSAKESHNNFTKIGPIPELAFTYMKKEKIYT